MINLSPLHALRILLQPESLAERQARVFTNMTAKNRKENG
jgi:hypothetical protein